MKRIRNDKIYNFLNKDVKEINKIALSAVCIGILSLAGYVSYYFTNNSFAFFTDSLSGSKTIELEVDLCEKKAYVEKDDTSGANAPVLGENMIPVYYDECNEVWKKADKENQNGVNKWYNYSKKKWANSVTVTNERRNEYKNANPGTEIPMNDILTMQVWIPRYKYTVWNYNADGEQTSEPQAINIKFEEGTRKTGEISCTDSISATDGAPSETCTYNNTPCTDSLCNGKTYTHPAFTFGDDELRGIWVGKFKNSATSIPTEYDNTTLRNVLVKPNVRGWTLTNIRTFESSMMKMNDNGNMYGFTTNEDTHMMKNMDWGAVVYLSHSKYGFNRNVYWNNSNSESPYDNGYYTGRSAGYAPETESEVSSVYGFYTYDGYLLNEGTNTKSSTKNLQKIASTTGNIYGIYDMASSFDADEYVMGNVVSNDGETMMSQHSGYLGMGYRDWNIIYPITEGDTYPDSKYVDKYSYGSDYTTFLRSKLGDALKEVYVHGSNGGSWYSENTQMTIYDYPWIMRGQNGIFHSSGHTGKAEYDDFSRLVITID